MIAPLRPRLARLSMRSRLLLGILPPVVLLVGLNTASLYREALQAADTAYDRTLLASAKSIGEQLEVVADGGRPRLQAVVPYSALEAFEADNRSRMYFKVSGFDGEMVSGFDDLKAWRGRLPDRGIYAALVDFYDDRFRGDPVRVAVLLQPVTGLAGQGMATIQVAETLELRRTLARQLLVDTLWRQAALLAVIVVVVWVVVARATRPVQALSAAIKARPPDDPSPLQLPDTPRELQPLVDATNDALARVADLVAHQRRFVRDASHQLRTPLAVLKAQVQSAQRGDLPATEALHEIGQTVDGATRLANQMLALAKLEQLRQSERQGAGLPPLDWQPLVREVALELGALMATADLELDLMLAPAPVRAHEWALRELTRNLLHNAIKHSPRGGTLAVSLAASVAAEGAQAALRIRDDGPGIPPALRARLFLPFAAGQPGSGSGLGLAICRDIVEALGGKLTLEDRPAVGLPGPPIGLDAIVRLPLASPPPPAPVGAGPGGRPDPADNPA